MKTLHYPQHDRLEMAEQPVPRPGEGEVLLRVAACGICGSELEAFKKRSPRRVPPLIMGHEFCGVVEEVGPGVGRLARGDRVVSHSQIRRPDDKEYAGGYEAHEGYAAPAKE